MTSNENTSVALQYQQAVNTSKTIDILTSMKEVFRIIIITVVNSDK